MKTKHLYAPNGARIIGTLEEVQGTALIESVSPRKNGGFNIEYEGTTEIDWDSSETVTRDGRRIFVDEEGGHWPENMLKLR